MRVIALSSFFLLLSIAHASSELDQRYLLERVAFLRPADNIDQLFSELVGTAYKEYFAKQSRFELVDIHKADSVLEKSSLPYHQLVEDKEILEKVCRQYKVETVIRTRIQREGASYRFALEWLHAPKMDLIADSTFQVEDPKQGEPLAGGQLKEKIQKATEEMIAKVPFKGHVTGREEQWVTVNIGASSGVKKGDLLQIGSLERVKHHPILGSIVEWHLINTGTAVVDNVEDQMAFAKVVEEEQGRLISRNQKVRSITHPPEADPQLVRSKSDDSDHLDETPPSYGYASGGIFGGGMSRSVGGTSGKSGSNFVFGGHVDGQAWLTEKFFADVGFTFGLHGYSQIASGASADTTATEIGSGSFSRFKIDLGYYYQLRGNFFGPKLWGKLGYHSISWSLPENTTEVTGPLSVSGIMGGLGAELPIRDRWGARFDFELGLFNSATTADALNLGSSIGTTAVALFAGGYYRLKPRIHITGGLNLLSLSTEFDSGTTISNSALSFEAGLMYYF